MAAPTYEPIATITLSSSVSTVSFDSLNQSYRDFILIIKGGTDSDSSLTIEFNNDTGNNYSSVQMQGNGSSTGSFTRTDISPETGNTTGNNHWILQFFDYSATDKHKTGLSANAGQSIVNRKAYRYASTSAITSIQIKTGSTFTSGTQMSLYGIEA